MYLVYQKAGNPLPVFLSCHSTSPEISCSPLHSGVRYWFTATYNWTLSPVKFCSHHVSSWSILILSSCLYFPIGLLPSCFLISYCIHFWHPLCPSTSCCCSQNGSIATLWQWASSKHRSHIYAEQLGCLGCDAMSVSGSHCWNIHSTSSPLTHQVWCHVTKWLPMLEHTVFPSL
jgi:hypothetical protein